MKIFRIHLRIVHKIFIANWKTRSIIQIEIYVQLVAAFLLFRLQSRLRISATRIVLSRYSPTRLRDIDPRYLAVCIPALNIMLHQFNGGCSSEDPSPAPVIWNIVSPFSIDEEIGEPSLARKLLVWPTLVLSLLVAGRLLFGRDFRLPTTTLVFRDDGGISMLDSSHRKSQQNAGLPGPPAYAAGMYMAGRQPRNESTCRWYHGLPEVLSYSSSRITWSPEIGEKSPYRVLPFVLLGAVEIESLPQVTLSTHATADQVYGIVELARRWEGPLSLAVFAPGLDAGLAVAQLDRACRCEPTMYKVSVHLVFPAGRPPALNAISRIQGDCAASDLQWRQTETERWKKRMTYPINVARNVARTVANTSRVLVSDIELLPSAQLASGFMEMVRQRPPKLGVVFVVPVFEIESNEPPPATKRELLTACRAGLAAYFHRFICPHCQRFPGLTRWMIKPDPGRIRPLIVTKREYPHHRWEPVFIGTRDDPLYTEEMSWEGKQDKMAQMFEMCLLNYRLVVLDGAFLVHTPGIKRKAHKISVATQEFFRPHEKKNARIYQRVVKRLIKRYPINRRCAQ